MMENTTAPDPPPVPPTPPSKGRILALKCYRKVSHSFTKGFTKKKKETTGSSSGGESETEPEPEEGQGIIPSSVSSETVSSDPSPSSSVTTENSFSSFYENLEFFSSTAAEVPLWKKWEETESGCGVVVVEEEEEDDDSSKWTLSAHTEESNEMSGGSEGTRKGGSRIMTRPVSVPPPVPNFPSSSESSSDDSFNSCASNPEQLAEISTKDKCGKPLSLPWGTVNNKVEDSEEDKTEVTTDELGSEDEGEEVLEIEKIEDVLPLTFVERPETGPGDECSETSDYQNVDVTNGNLVFDVVSNANRIEEDEEIGAVHAVINLPPRIMNVIKERRRKLSMEDQVHHKSARLSRLLVADLKSLEIQEGSERPGSKLKALVVPKRKVGMGRMRRLLSRTKVKTPETEVEGEDSLDSNLQEDGSKGANEFEELRRMVKQGGDFCKDLATVLHERSELESQYAKGLSKLSAKLLKASKEAKGSVAHAWQAVACQAETQAELHRQWSSALEDELAKPLRTSTDTQHKIRKSVEVLVDKTTRNLADWRTAEAKAKRHCFSSSKEFEKLAQQENHSPNNIHQSNNRLNTANNNNSNSNSVLPEVRTRSRLLSVPPGDKDPIKLESKRKKAEEAVRRADVDYYTFCVRSERARLEWEGAIRNGSTCLKTLEEEKLSLLKEMAEKYLHHLLDFGPKLVTSVESLEEPVKGCNVQSDIHAINDIRRHVGAEQLLPDFYAEDTSNLMGRQRRHEALQKCMYLINQDLEREKKGAVGVETLAKAIAEGPKMDNSHHDISDKLYYMRSMLLYLVASRCKVDNSVADVEGRQRVNHPITQYMRHQRDKQGLPQTILKVPSWAREDCLVFSSPESTSGGSNSPNWNDRGKADGTSAHHDNDFDEFGSEGSAAEGLEGLASVEETKSIIKGTILSSSVPSIGKCRAIYDYDANLFDELTIRVGEEINIHDKQEDGWWLGELNGVIGIFPATYVEEMPPTPVTTPSPSP